LPLPGFPLSFQATPATLKNLATELVGGCHQVAVADLYQFGRLFD